MKQIDLMARVDSLGRVLAFIEGELEAADCPMKAMSQIAIAAEEVYVNIAHYAYGGEPGPCSVRIGIEAGELTLQFEDQGGPYNPLQKADPDIALSAEDRDIGGLGIFMVKKIMDSADYQRDGDKNVLTLRKTL